MDDRPFDDSPRAQLRMLLELQQNGVVVPHHRGVYVDHTGRLSWQQRAWAAVLVHWPAALARGSALPRPSCDGPVHVAIAPGRKVVEVPRILTHRTPDLEARVDWRRSPPRVRLPHAVIDVASVRRDDVAGVFRLLTDVCHTRETGPAEIGRVLEGRRVAGRRLLGSMLEDLRAGACSVLERGYLERVERAHGLPAGRRQKPATAGDRAIARDVEYEGLGLVVELDGLAFHDGARARDRDALRDLTTVVEGRLTTVRITYGLVFDTPCRTARSVGILLRRGGWTGILTSCPACIDVEVAST